MLSIWRSRLAFSQREAWYRNSAICLTTHTNGRVENPRLITYAETEVPVTPLETVTLIEGVVKTDVPEAPRRIAVWPNPVQGELHYRTGALEVSCIHLLDALGREIQVYAQAPARIDFSSLPAGRYQLRFITSEGVAYRTIVKL